MQSVSKDERGTLIALEFSKLPFIPRRIFTISDVPKGTIRGNHGHTNTDQYFYVLSGEARVRTKLNGEAATYMLKNSSMGLFLPRLTWASQEYLAERSTLVVIASEPYDPSDYFL
jgi:dTDP-4-dehydrorhamnose 3,5-epimerase-like enzyme